MARLSRWVLRLATVRALIAIQLLNATSFGVLFWLESRFTALTGLPVFDTQNELTAQGIRAQIAAYAGPARDAYVLFAAYDFVFPLIASLSLVVLCAVLLRFNTFAFAQRLLAKGFPLVFLPPALFDWGENVGMLAIIRMPQPSDAAIAFALLFKQLKLVSLAVSGGLIGGLFLFAVANWVVRFARHVRR